MQPIGASVTQVNQGRKAAIQRAAQPARFLWRCLPQATRRRFVTRGVRSRFGLETIRNAWIDRKYGGGRVASRSATRFPQLGVFGYSGADYVQLRRIFDQQRGVKVSADDVLVDVGCGKGRVINFWLDQGWTNRMVGIEIDPELGAAASHRLSRFSNVEIVISDIRNHVPLDGTIFFMFNPCSEVVLAEFKETLVDALGADSSFRIVYYYPLKRDVFDADPRWIVEPLAVSSFYPTLLIRMASTAELGVST